MYTFVGMITWHGVERRAILAEAQIVGFSLRETIRLCLILFNTWVSRDARE
jgi:hypothetical protein